MKIHNYGAELKELADCPFCGGRPVAHLIGNEHSKIRKIEIKCPDCMAKRTVCAMRQTTEWLEEKAIGLWNKRA